MLRGSIAFLFAGLPALAAVLVQHDYDPVSDAVVSWRLDPGRSVTQSFSLPRGTPKIGGFRVKLQRWSAPGIIEYRIGSRRGAADIVSGELPAFKVSPWFEQWFGAQFPAPVPISRTAPLYLQLKLASGSEGHIEVFGTASGRIDRPEFTPRFQYIENWFPKTARSGDFENPANIDYGFRTPRYEGGSAYDSHGTELAPLDLAFQIFDQDSSESKCEERFSFVESITGPLYPGTLRDPIATPRVNEIALDRTWNVSEPAGAGAVVHTAVSEFREFLTQAMDIKSLASSAHGIRLDSHCAAAPQISEGFHLGTKNDSIEICGYDDRGVMQGLHYLEATMKMRRAPFSMAGDESLHPAWPVRITSAPFYSKAELETPIDQYTPGLLGRISRAGFNAIWVWGDLDEVAHSEIYPELDRGVAGRQAKLNDLIRRASVYGIDVYVQLASRSLPESFYRKHPDVRGSALPAYGGVNILCTSVPEVREHIRSSTKNLTTAVPGLKGVMFIVGGEGFLHCYTRRNTCPRCSRRKPRETIAEFSTAIFEGVRSGNPKAAVALWPYSASNTWSKDDTTQFTLLNRLPKGMTLLTEFEKEGAISFGGVTIPAYDYSISFLGPSDRFVEQAEITRKQSLNLWVKAEHAISLEIVDTPYIPVFFRWAERFKRIRETPGVSAVFANWMHYGFMPTIAADVFYWSSWSKPVDAGTLLRNIASRDFGAGAEEAALSAWGKFSDAIREYPFSGAMAMGVIQKGPAHPLFFDPSYKPAHGAGRQFKNDLTWTRPWGPELAIAQFTKMRDGWARGVADLETVVSQADPAQKGNAERERGIARVLLSSMNSVMNVARFYMLRQELLPTTDVEKARDLLDRMTAIANEEIHNARTALPYVCADSRLGYANSGKSDQEGVPRAGIYSPGSIEKKIAQVERMLRKEIPDYRKAHGL